MSRPVTGAGTEKLSAAVHFLNVGWGDAHLIRLPSGELTLIDGGDGGMTRLRTIRSPGWSARASAGWIG